MKNGISEIPASSLARLAGFYKTSVDYLLGLTNEKSPSTRSKDSPIMNPKGTITLCPKCTNYIRQFI